MLHTTLKPDLQSCFSELIMLARRHDLVLIARESNLYRVHYSSKFDAESIEQLKTLDTIHIIVRGKTSKSTLNKEQRDLLTQYVRESNRLLN